MRKRGMGKSRLCMLSKRITKLSSVLYFKKNAIEEGEFGGKEGKYWYKERKRRKEG